MKKLFIALVVIAGISASLPSADANACGIPSNQPKENCPARP